MADLLGHQADLLLIGGGMMCVHFLFSLWLVKWNVWSELFYHACVGCGEGQTEWATGSTTLQQGLIQR
jgi:hypothetical protein